MQRPPDGHVKNGVAAPGQGPFFSVNANDSRIPPSGGRKIRADHQVNMTAERLSPFPEFFSEGPLGGSLAGGFQGHQALMHQIKGVINQLSSLFGGHGAAGDGMELEPNRSVALF